MIERITISGYPSYPKNSQSSVIDYYSKERDQNTFTLNIGDDRTVDLMPLYITADLDLEKDDNQKAAFSRGEIMGLIMSMGKPKNIVNILKTTMLSNTSSGPANFEIVYYLKKEKEYVKYKYIIIFGKQGIISQELYQLGVINNKWELIVTSYENKSLYEDHEIMYPKVYNYFYYDVMHLLQSTNINPLLKKTNSDPKFMSFLCKSIKIHISSDTIDGKNKAKLLQDVLAIAEVSLNLDSSAEYSKVVDIKVNESEKAFPLHLVTSNGMKYNIKEHVMGQSNYSDKLALVMIMYMYLVSKNTTVIVTHPDQIYTGDSFTNFAKLMKYCINYKTDRQEPCQLLIVIAEQANLGKILKREYIE